MSVLVALQGAANDRTVGDTLAGESGAQLPLLLSGGGTGTGITEAVSSSVGYVRTASDSVSSISETTSRTFGTVRTVADALATLAETVARIVGKLASAADTLAGSGGASLPLLLSGGEGSAGISETVTTESGVTRTADDSVGDITETLGEDATQIRGTADSLDAVDESVARIGTFERATADSVASITETVEAVHTPSGPVAHERSVADSIEAISEAITEPVATGSVEPAPGVLVPRMAAEPPRRLVRAAFDHIYDIHEAIDTFYTEDEDWLLGLSEERILELV